MADMIASYRVYTREDGKRFAVVDEGRVNDGVRSIVVVDDVGNAHLRVIRNADWDKLPAGRFRMTTPTEYVDGRASPVAPPLCAIPIDDE